MLMKETILASKTCSNDKSLERCVMNDLNGLFVEISKEIDCLPLREKKVVEEAIAKFIARRSRELCMISESILTK